MPRDAAPRTGPSATEASSTLAELDAVGRRSRRALVAGVTRMPLIAWGIAWAVGYPLLDQAHWVIAVPVGIALALAAMAATWWLGSPELRSGWESRSRNGWLVLMASSPLLVAVVTPLRWTVILLFLGALWGVGLVLMAVAIGDRGVGVVGAVVVLAAAATRITHVGHALTWFGLAAGAAMLLLGCWRIGRRR